MSAQWRLLVVVITMGNRQDVEECIASLKCSSTTSFDILVVQNTRASCLDGLDGAIETIVSGGNVGFAKGNNLGIKRSLELGYDATLLLNDDMVVEPNMLERLGKTLQSSAKIGLAGPATYFYDNPQVIWAAGGDIAKLRVRVAGKRRLSANINEVGYLPGSGIAFKNSIIAQTGLLPEKYFYAYEEAEFCVRARRSGLLSVVDPQAKAWHKVGITSKRIPETVYNDFRNRLLFSEFLHGQVLGRLLGRLIIIRELIRSSKTARSLAKRAWRDHQRYQEVHLNHLLAVRKLYGRQL
jgi:GT2 family glycosyltransferase